MRCDWVFRWWIHWCERFGQICERTGSACYLIHAVSPVGHELNIAGQVVTALSLWPHAYHPSIWRGGGVEQMNRGPRWGGSAHTHTHSHTTLTPPILCLNVYWNIHTSSYGAAARTAWEMLGGGLKCDAKSLLKCYDSVCRLHWDPQSIFRFSGTLHFHLCAVKKAYIFNFTVL